MMLVNAMTMMMTVMMMMMMMMMMMVTGLSERLSDKKDHLYWQS